MSEAFAKFNPNIIRNVYVIGDSSHVESMVTLFKSQYYLKVVPINQLPALNEEPFYVIGVIEFESSSRVQNLAKIFTDIESQGTYAHRLILANSPDNLNAEQILFAQELGARYVAYGKSRFEDIRDYLKTSVMEAHKVGSMLAFELEFQAACRKMNVPEIKSIIQRLKETGAEGDEVYRLFVLAHIKINDYKMTEYYLKQMLRKNPQNLWAANMLGKMLLKSGRVNEGIELLERLSLFHELNGERLLTLGTAYVNSGESTRAAELFEMGDTLAEGEDDRYKVGLAKTKLLAGDLGGALEIAGKDGFSEDLIRFLNMRAIVAIRKARFSDGLGFYNQAQKGCRDPVTRSKILFNMGLAHVKNADLSAAKACFSDSIRYGGAKFRRADGPLGIVNQVMKKRAEGDTNTLSASELIDIDFESLY